MSNFYLWTIYDRPSDYPDSFVARKFIVDRPTDEVIVRDTLAEVREAIGSRALVRIERSPSDDPKIVEVWL
jgi:hypothetical protein